MKKTPVKYSTDVCLICSSTLRLHNISTSLKERRFLEQYLEISVINGNLCRNCSSKLYTINNKLDELKQNQRKTAAVYQRRCANLDITSQHSEKKQRSQYSPIIARNSLIPVRIPTSNKSLQQVTHRTILPKPGSFIPIRSPKKAESKGTAVSAKRKLNLTEHSYYASTSVSDKSKPSEKCATTVQDPAVKLLMNLCKNEESEDQLTPDEKKKLQAVIHNGNKHQVCAVLQEIPSLLSIFEEIVISRVSSECGSFGNRKEGVSYLFHKSYNDLKTMSWSAIVQEMCSKVPFAAKLFLSIMLPTKFLSTADKVKHAIPRLAMMWSIAIQNRFDYLSKVQRVLTLTLGDCIVDQKKQCTSWTIENESQPNQKYCPNSMLKEICMNVIKRLA